MTRGDVSAAEGRCYIYCYRQSQFRVTGLVRKNVLTRFQLKSRCLQSRGRRRSIADNVQLLSAFGERGFITDGCFVPFSIDGRHCWHGAYGHPRRHVSAHGGPSLKRPRCPDIAAGGHDKRIACI
jgi:hypothetical protein